MAGIKAGSDVLYFSFAPPRRVRGLLCNPLNNESKRWIFRKQFLLL
jgi:hypothetical protein